MASAPPALDYAPNLWFDSQEQYYPVNPLDFYFENNQEISGQEAIEKYNQLSFKEKVNNLTVLYHIQDNASQWVYQYWFFYVFNDSLGKIKNQHYGDWEAVFVFVDKNSKQVNKAIGTAHQRRLFDTEILNPDNNHIWTYVGAGSHANCVDDEGDGYCNFFMWDLSEKWDKNGLKIPYTSYKLKEITSDFINEFNGKMTLEKSAKLGISIPNFLRIVKKDIYIPWGGSPPIYAWRQPSYDNPEELRPITSYISEKTNQAKDKIAGAWGYWTDQLAKLFSPPEFQQAGISGNLIGDSSSTDTKEPEELIVEESDSSINWFFAEHRVNRVNQETPLPEPVFSQTSAPVLEQEADVQSETGAGIEIVPVQEQIAEQIVEQVVEQETNQPLYYGGDGGGVPQASAAASVTTPTSTSDVISTSTPVAAYPVINEVQLGDYEFVELYNSTNQSIDMTGWYWSYFSSNRDWNNPHRNQQFPNNATIPAGGYYLIGLNGFPETGGYLEADWQVHSSNQLNDSNGSVAIFPWDPTSTTSAEAEIGAIDALGWGEVDYVYKTATSSPPGLNKSLVRQSNNEFTVDDWPSPKNSQGQTVTVAPDSTAITQNTTWYSANSPYILESNSGDYPTVASGASLTIEAGVTIKGVNKYYPSLIIKGTLKAQGTSANPITFTSATTTQLAGDWSGIIFDNSTSTESVLDYVNFKYGGYQVSYGGDNQVKEMVKIDNSFVTIRNSSFKNSLYHGIRLVDSNASVADAVFEGNSSTGIIINGSNPGVSNSQFTNNDTGIEIINQASPAISNNTFSNNTNAVKLKSSYPSLSGNQANNNNLNGVFVDSESVFSQNTTWTNDLVYILNSGSGDYPTVATGTVLTIEPSVIIKPYSKYYTALLIEGELIALGATSTPIVFTSLKDDTYGGDTNSDDSATTPAAGDWKNIKFSAGSIGSLNHIRFRYGGYGASDVIDIDANATVTSSNIVIEP